MRFATCACEPLVVAMVRARIWRSSPQHPHIAFTFDLLDWAEALLLECQVSVEHFCKSYPVLMPPFNEDGEHPLYV